MDPISAQDLIVLGCKTAIIVLFLYFGYKLLGKRQTGSMNIYDLAGLMAVSNAVQNSMTSGKGNLGVGLVCSSVIIGLAWFLTKIFVRAPKLESRMCGIPTILVKDGHMYLDRMYQESISRDELRASMRQHGIMKIAEVHLAVLEVDGTITIVQKGETSQTPQPTS